METGDPAERGRLEGRSFQEEGSEDLEGTLAAPVTAVRKAGRMV